MEKPRDERTAQTLMPDGRDITERKRAEDRLRQYERAVEAAGGMIAVVDREYRILLANRKCATMRNMGKDEILGRFVHEVLNKGVFEAVVKPKLDECFQGKVVRYEMKYPYPELGERDVAVSYFPIGGDTGVEGAACILQDITEHKQAEEALRQSEERFRLAAQAGNMYAYTWNVATDAIVRSGDVSRVLGSTGEASLTRQQLLTRVHPDDRALFNASVNERTPERPDVQISYRMLRPDGSVVWVEKTAHALFDEGGRMVRVIGMVADITKRKLADEALLKNEERFRLAALAGKMFAYEWDVATDVIVRSADFAQVLGNEPVATTGQQILARIHPDDRERVKAAVAALSPENPHLRISYRTARSDGAMIWVERTSRAHFDEQGKMLRLVGMVADVTERKQAEEALRESAERLRLAAQAGRMYAFEWDVTTDVIVRSSEYVNVLGATEPQTLTHQQAMEKIHLEDRLKLVAAVARHSPENPTVDVTYRVLFPGKPPIWVKSSGRAFFDTEGRMLRVIGMVADVTDQKLAEEALRDSEERLRLAQHVARIGSFERNIRTGATTWTAEMESMYGLPPGGFGQTRTAFENLVHPDDRAEVVKLVDEALRTGQPMSGEWRVIWADGSVHWIAGRWQVLMDESGEPSRVVGVNLDITERKWAEEALHDSKERFRLVANTAPVMIWMSGLDKKPTYFNQLWLDFTGLPETELQNGLAGIVHPEDYPQCHEVYCRGFDQRQPFRKECRLRRHDGQYRWMLDIGVPRFHKDGSFAGYIGSCIDVTDHKLAEEALSGMSRKLVEAQEQERARIARELHDDISQRLAMLAVELEQLKENPSEIESRVEELRKRTTEISNSVQALSHDLHSSQLEYLGAVAGIRSWCKEFAERQGMEIDCRHDVRSSLPPEIGLCLFRVLQEALHNAAKHSGVKRIEVQLEEKSGEIHLMVRDSGRGFDVEAAKQGKGLGLTSMRERVRLVEGTIVIDSKPMGGTTIDVRVPFKSEQEAQREAV